MVERSKRIELRVTADELMKIHERMEEAGISSLFGVYTKFVTVSLEHINK